jgi:hypothetical protein
MEFGILNMRDPFKVDPDEPPDGGAGLNAAELALWAGHCPWCDRRASFSYGEEDDGSVICRWCGAEFMADGFRDVRATSKTVTALYVEGDPAKRAATADDLPAVTARP